MKIKRTIELQSGSGDVLTEQNKNDYILVVGSMFKAGELTDDLDLLLNGGLIGNAEITKAVVDAQGFDGINAYTVPELVDIMCGATDVDMADLMKVLIKHSSFKDLSAALDIADPWQSNKTKENIPYTSVTKDTIGLVKSKPLDEPIPELLDESIEDLVMADAESLLESAGILAAVECVEQYPEWKKDIRYSQGDHVSHQGIVYKRNSNPTPKRAKYSFFDDRDWDEV